MDDDSFGLFIAIKNILKWYAIVALVILLVWVAV